MRLAWAFFKREALIEMSYKTSFAFQLFNGLLVLLVCYFIGSMVKGEDVAELAVYGGNYLAFILVGIALQDCVAVSMTSFGKQIREGQLTGTLEATLMSPVGLPTILVYSSLWNYFLSAIRFILYLVFGSMLYGVSMREANFPAVILIFLLTVVCFAGMGIVWAAIIMWIKRGEGMANMFGYVVLIVSGVLVPIAQLPGWLQSVAYFIPLTHALEAMRRALIRGESLQQMPTPLATLIVFAVIFVALGMGSFSYAVHYAKKNGTLTEY